MTKVRKLFTTLILSVILITSFSGCDNGVKPMDMLTKSSINISAANCARGYLQAIFTYDENLFMACFPEDAYDRFRGPEYFKSLCEITDASEFTFLGTRNGAVRPIGEEEDTLFKDTAIRIASVHGVDENSITDIQVVNTKVYFSSDGKNFSNDCYVMVYKSNNFWYAFELETPEEETDS